VSTISKVRGILFILIATSAALLATIVLYSQEQIRQQSSIIEIERIVKVNQLASRIDLIITEAEKILENAAKDENIRNSPYISYIDSNLHGIPENVENQKRVVIRNILSTYSDFESIGYILPNGDIYFVEPYDLQKPLSISNVSFRNYYKAVTATHETYVDSILVSAASQHPVAAIAVPIFSKNSSMIGILASGMDLNTVQKRLQELHSYTNERILVVDNNRALVADSDETGYKSGEIVPEMGAIQDAFAGKNGTTVESINGQKMFLAYHPVIAGQNTWAVVSIQPYDEAFQSVNATIQESYTLAILILIITSISSYYLYKGFQAQQKTTKELENANQVLQRVQEELKEVDKSKEEFSAMITHELKTPLVPIIGYCKMLKTSMLGKLNEEESDAIEVIEKNAKSLEELISDIMDIHKLDIDKMKFYFENLSLDEFFGTLDSSYKKVLKEKGIEFVTKLSSIKGLVINTDKTRLRQVFDNLIGNSIKFVSENNGLIEVGGYKDKDGLILYVKDDGIGIPKDKQPELFKKFYQVDTSERRKVGGTGLGLVISKGIMEKLEGTIWVESDGKTGTTLYLKLPLNEQKDQ
jgi:signal transduction histidine kinase